MANPNKPRDIKLILAKNHEKLLALLQSLSPGKGFISFPTSLDYPQPKAKIKHLVLVKACVPQFIEYVWVIAGAEDDQFEEEKELIIKEIDRVHRLAEI